jgi:2-polyprenyl-3-methyl-5-hydroxy-6-metoxy-1,4-benzoquinol methylase
VRPREVASALKDVVLAAIEERAHKSSALQALERARSLVGASRKIRYDAKPAEFEDDVAEMWFPSVNSDQVRRANDAFLSRLTSEFEQLFTHSRDVKDRSIPADVFVDPEALREQKVLEIGCGAGELAKRLAPLAKAWVGIDDSTAALKLARLVAPENAIFVHPSQHVSLAVHHGSVETVVGRRMLVHKNLEEAKELLGFLAPFLVTGGRAYIELYFPNPEIARDRVYPAAHPPAGPGAFFAYSRSNVEALIQKLPFTIARDEERPDRERRFVVLDKTEIED